MSAEIQEEVVDMVEELAEFFEVTPERVMSMLVNRSKSFLEIVLDGVEMNQISRSSVLWLMGEGNSYWIH